MLLPSPELVRFFRLHRTLMFFVNQRLEVVPDKVSTPEEFAQLLPEVLVKVRDALLNHPDLIQAFVAENPASLPEEELDLVRSWQNMVAGKFYIFRYLKNYTVFLSAHDQPIAYGVLALSQPFQDLAGPYLPVLVETVLLPFKDKIVYDALMSAYSISFGAGIRRRLNDSFKESKALHGIVTSLPMSERTLPAKTTKPRHHPKVQRHEETTEVLKVIVGMIEEFCHQHLSDEYAALCVKMAEKLARKRPSPLLSGSPNTWASGIVRAVGWVNFLQDKTQKPHMRLGDIDAHFGIGESTGAAKLAAIRKMLKIHQLDPNWTLPSKMDDNPMVWILNVNGFMMDIRRAPRETQEIAFRKGLIPYIPADR